MVYGHMWYALWSCGWGIPRWDLNRVGQGQRQRQSQEGVVTGSMWFDYSFEATVTWYQMRALSKEGWK